jgi:hypothetical protein
MIVISNGKVIISVIVFDTKNDEETNYIRNSSFVIIAAHH